MNITDPIRRRARIDPDAVGVILANHAGISYRAFDRLIDATAAVLAANGVVPGQTVGLAIVGPNEFPGLAIAFALARLGAVSADPALPASRMELCIREAGRAATAGVRNLPIEAIWAALPPPDAAVAEFPAFPDGAAPFRIFASSGTTGTPKFAAIGHDLMAGRVHSNQRALGGDDGVRICGAGLGITWGFSTVLRTLWAGGTLVLTEPAQAAAAIARHRVTSLVIAPVSLQTMLATRPPGAPPLPSLQRVEIGGSALPAPLHAAIRERLGGQAIAYFGTTETGGVASAPAATLAGDPLAVGIVHPGIEVEAVDGAGRPLPPGEAGVLRIRSPHVIAGYLGDAAGDVFRDGWFQTGDLGSVSPGGVMRVTGRASEVINRGGQKLSPHVIEDVLLTLPGVTDAAAFGVPDALGVVQIWAAIVAAAPVDRATLNDLCRERLAEKSPRFIVQVKALPRNANGKILREELVHAALARQSAEASGQAAR